MSNAGASQQSNTPSNSLFVKRKRVIIVYLAYYDTGPFRRLANGRWLKERMFQAVNAGVSQRLLSRQYRQWCFVMRSSHGPHNEDTVLLYRTIVSGALLSEVNNNRSLSGNNYWWLTNFRAASKPECRPLGRIF